MVRKRRKSKDDHEWEKVKKILHSGGGKVPEVWCNHTARLNSRLCHADLLTEGDLAMKQARFYEVPDKVVQDQALLHLMMITKPKWLRKRLENIDCRKDRKVVFSLQR